MKIGDEIMHNGRFKKIITIGEGWIETVYSKPNDMGWCKVEKVWLNDLYYTIDLKIGEYRMLHDGMIVTLIGD